MLHQPHRITRFRLNHRLFTLHTKPHRCYFVPSALGQQPFPQVQTAILSAALSHVPEHGFRDDALKLGAKDVGYLPASTALFPRGAYHLVLYHLTTQRLALKDLATLDRAKNDQGPSVTFELRRLLLARLHGNTAVLSRMDEALGLMSLASNIPSSLAELGRLSDELWYLAGDKSVDSSWYTKRGMLAAVYASTEVYMMQDDSKDYKETERFLDRRLDEVRQIGSAAGSVGQWIGFTGLSSVNVLRSWGARI